jgi:hypothetical protein
MSQVVRAYEDYADGVLTVALDSGVEVKANGVDRGVHSWTPDGIYVLTGCQGSDGGMYTLKWKFGFEAFEVESKADLPWDSASKIIAVRQ